MDVSIIIVNYNTKNLTRNCLSSIYKQTKDISFEIIVSDNGSTDGSLEMIKQEFPKVILIENNANLGFGAANNRGLKIAKGKYIFYLNSDTLLLNNAVKIFFDYWENYKEKDSLGALGCNLINMKQEVIHSYYKFPTYKNMINELLHNIYGVTKLSIKKILLNKNIECTKPYIICKKKIGCVDYITGADLFLLNNFSARFDENYFMYCEEADLEYSFYKTGKLREIIDGPNIAHLKGCSSDKTYDLIHIHGTFSHIYNMISRIYFLKKNDYQKINLFLIKLLTLILWLNPFIFNKTKKYILKMLHI